MSQQFKKKFGLFKKKSVTREINGVSFEFYPVSLGKLMSGEMASTLQPVMESLSALLQKTNTDVEKLQEVDEKEGKVFTRTLGISEKLAKYRDEQRGASLKKALDACISDKTRRSIGRLLMDSLRDDCPRNPTDEEVATFIDAPEMDLPTVVEFFKGFLEANVGLFGETGKALSDLVKSRVKAALEAAQTPPPPILTVLPKEPEDEEDESPAPDAEGSLPPPE